MAEKLAKQNLPKNYITYTLTNHKLLMKNNQNQQIQPKPRYEICLAKLKTNYNYSTQSAFWLLCQTEKFKFNFSDTQFDLNGKLEQKKQQELEKRGKSKITIHAFQVLTRTF